MMPRTMPWFVRAALGRLVRELEVTWWEFVAWWETAAVADRVARAASCVRGRARRAWPPPAAHMNREKEGHFRMSENDTKSEKTPVNRELLEATLDVIRQSLQADGGDVALVNVDDEGVVTLEMQGACAGCPLSSFDMSEGIERILKEHVPGVTQVRPAMEW